MGNVAESDFHEAMVALALWRNANPAGKLDTEPPEIVAQRRIVMLRLSALQEGDVDPWMCQRIEILIRKSSRYIVYLDDQLEIQWWWTQRLSSEEGMSVIQANIMRLSSASNFLLDAQSDLLKAPFPKTRLLLRFVGWFRRMNEAQHDASIARARDSAKRIRMLIAESMAMALNGVSRAECEKVQMMAEDQILVARDQLCRPVFFWWALYVLALLGVANAGVGYLNQHYTLMPGFAVMCQAALAGAFGALLSVTTRTRSLKLEPESGKRGLRLEAVCRLLIGAGAGILVHLAFDAGLILKAAFEGSNADVTQAIHAFLCIASGWSEKILPSLLGRAESFVTVDDKVK